MRVVLRTPAELVAEYDLPDMNSTSTDAEIIAAAASIEPVRRGDVEVVGQPYVFARGLDDLARQGKRLQHAEARLDEEKAAARVMARQLFDQGTPKQTIAANLGITRPTLDAWLRAPRRQPPARARRRSPGLGPA